MNVTLSLDDALVKKSRKIAVDRDTTLSGLIRDYLEQLIKDEEAFGRARRERRILEESFDRLQFNIGKRTWKRSDLYDRS